jgi:hypothetical protein
VEQQGNVAAGPVCGYEKALTELIVSVLIGYFFFQGPC